MSKAAAAGSPPIPEPELEAGHVKWVGCPLFPAGIGKDLYYSHPEGLKPGVIKVQKSADGIPIRCDERFHPFTFKREHMAKHWGEGTYMVEILSTADNGTPEPLFPMRTIVITRDEGRAKKFPGKNWADEVNVAAEAPPEEAPAPARAPKRQAAAAAPADDEEEEGDGDDDDEEDDDDQEQPVNEAPRRERAERERPRPAYEAAPEADMPVAEILRLRQELAAAKAALLQQPIVAPLAQAVAPVVAQAVESAASKLSPEAIGAVFTGIAAITSPLIVAMQAKADNEARRIEAAALAAAEERKLAAAAAEAERKAQERRDEQRREDRKAEEAKAEALRVAAEERRLEQREADRKAEAKAEERRDERRREEAKADADRMFTLMSTLSTKQEALGKQYVSAAQELMAVKPADPAPIILGEVRRMLDERLALASPRSEKAMSIRETLREVEEIRTILQGGGKEERAGIDWKKFIGSLVEAVGPNMIAQAMQFGAMLMQQRLQQGGAPEQQQQQQTAGYDPQSGYPQEQGGANQNSYAPTGVS